MKVNLAYGRTEYLGDARRRIVMCDKISYDRESLFMVWRNCCCGRSSCQYAVTG